MLKVLFGIAIVIGALWASSTDAHADGLLDDVLDVVPAVTTPVVDTVAEVTEPVAAVVPKVTKIVPKVTAVVPKVVEAVTELPVVETVVDEPAPVQAAPTEKNERATPEARTTPIDTVAPQTPAPATAPTPQTAAPTTVVDDRLPTPATPDAPAAEPDNQPALGSAPGGASSVADASSGVPLRNAASTLHRSASDLAPPGPPTFESDTTPD